VAQRRHHYENAFEHYLRAVRIPYVSVDEARKALLPDGARLGDTNGRAIKSFDFVVYGRDANLLVDIKGRKIPRRPGAASGGRSRFDSWATQDDVDGLLLWRRLFGSGFDAALVFLYWCEDQPPDGLFQEVFIHRERWYAVRAVLIDAYVGAMKTRSARWRTVHVPAADFERISSPFCAAPGMAEPRSSAPRGPTRDAAPKGALHPRTGPISSDQPW
jgi:hypothetical protein